MLTAWLICHELDEFTSVVPGLSQSRLARNCDPDEFDISRKKP